MSKILTAQNFGNFVHCFVVYTSCSFPVLLYVTASRQLSTVLFNSGKTIFTSALL